MASSFKVGVCSILPQAVTWGRMVTWSSGTVSWKSSWLCLLQMTGGQEQKTSMRGGNSLTAVKSRTTSRLSSRFPPMQDPSSPTTRTLISDTHSQFLVISIMGDQKILGNFTFCQVECTHHLPPDCPNPGAGHSGPLPHVFVANLPYNDGDHLFSYS